MNDLATNEKTQVARIKLFGDCVCRRTSEYSDRRPCDEAVRVPYVSVDRRFVEDPMKWPHLVKEWYNTGRNHRVENGTIARDFDGERWIVQIENEAALCAFCEKYGDIVLSINTDGLEPCYEIEIYDDYRE